MRPLLLPLLLGISACGTVQPFPVSELSFNSFWAMRAADTTVTYMLLGTGFFRTPRSDDHDSLIVAWLAEHPSAIVTPVTALERLVYVWVTDGESHLNLHLIRRGAYPGGVMTDAVDFENRMAKADMPMESGAKRLVSDDVYRAFVERVAEAERDAIADSLGIWARGSELQRH